MTDRLTAELQRLFLMGDSTGTALTTGDGQTRLLSLRLHRNADWAALADLFSGLEEALQLPLPALSVQAEGGYRLWFSLLEPVSITAGQGLLNGLVRRYLASLPAGRLEIELPHAGARLPEMPAYDADSERWSAFIDPGLGAMFCDEAGLDIPPGRDRQADLLVGVRSWRPADFARACSELAAFGDAPWATTPAPARVVAATAWQNVGTAYDNPQEFLLAVMNDPGASPEQRLRAAEALLPYRRP